MKLSSYKLEILFIVLFVSLIVEVVQVVKAKRGIGKHVRPLTTLLFIMVLMVIYIQENYTTGFVIASESYLVGEDVVRESVEERTVYTVSNIVVIDGNKDKINVNNNLNEIVIELDGVSILARENTNLILYKYNEQNGSVKLKRSK